MVAGRKKPERRDKVSPQDEAFESQAADSQSVDGLLTLVGIAKGFRVPAQFQPLQLRAIVRNAIDQLVDQNLGKNSRRFIRFGRLYGSST